MKAFSPRLAGFVALVLLLPRAPAFAHAMLERAEPRVGSTVNHAPGAVRIWFTQELEPVFSKITVFGPDGKQIDKKDTHLSAENKRELIVSLPGLSAGTYKVTWKVLSIDTHRTQGTFKFVVKP